MVNTGDIALASRVLLDAIMDEYYYVDSPAPVRSRERHPGQARERVAPVY